MTIRPRAAVIPAAGRGTRFLPATKSQPKEMLPVVDKPAIQYVVEEAVRAGLTDVLIVTGRGKRAIEDHFDRSFELEVFLQEAGKLDLLAEIQGITEMAGFHYVRQRDPLGLGHAVSLARDHVGVEPFVVLLGDDLIVDDSRLLTSMIETYERQGASVLALMEVSDDEIGAYGSASVEPIADADASIVRVRSVVEKPAPGQAPSNLAVIGRYVFTPEIFDALDRIGPGANGELQLTDAIAGLLEHQPVFGVVFSEGRYDVGDKAGWLRANVDLALARPDLGPQVRAFLDR
jgi:UTP--glucose-1-phosphate uridylyltransferase